MNGGEPEVPVLGLVEAEDKIAVSMTPTKTAVPRPPNRKKHEEEVGTLSTAIKELEDKRYIK